MDDNTKIGNNFTGYDVQFNETAIRLGIDNRTEDDQVIVNARLLARGILDRVVDQFGHVHITSWYRCENLEREYSRNAYARWCIANRLPIREDSWQTYLEQKQHHTGSAVTLRGDNDAIFHFILDNLEYDVLMHKEHWISVSFTKNNRKRAIGK